jgi:hypothetical protein
LGKRGPPGQLGKAELLKNKKTTNKASMSLKTKDGASKTKLKRTQNEPQLSAGTRKKGAENATFCENEAKTCEAQRAAATATSSRLDTPSTCIGADLISCPVAASDRRTRIPAEGWPSFWLTGAGPCR